MLPSFLTIVPTLGPGLAPGNILQPTSTVAAPAASVSAVAAAQQSLVAKAQSFLNTASTGANLINTNALKINPGDVAAQAPILVNSIMANTYSLNNATAALLTPLGANGAPLAVPGSPTIFSSNGTLTAGEALDISVAYGTYVLAAETSLANLQTAAASFGAAGAAQVRTALMTLQNAALAAAVAIETRAKTLGAAGTIVVSQIRSAEAMLASSFSISGSAYGHISAGH